MDLNRSLSPSFKLFEFVTSQTAARRGIDNTPTEAIIKNLTNLCVTILEPARKALGPLRISSGYRSPALNKAIGASLGSAHQLGYAADVVPLSATTMEFARWVAKNVKFDQVILEFGLASAPAWIHVSCDPQLRRQILQILSAKSGYKPIIL